MGKMELVFKSEVMRLAKKQVREVVAPLAREVRRLRRGVTELSRAVRALEKQGAELAKRRPAEAPSLEAEPDEAAKARLSPGLIKKLRKRLRVTQAELAKLTGVSSASVTFWERGRSRPGGENKAKLVALRRLGRREVRRLLEPAQ